MNLSFSEIIFEYSKCDAFSLLQVAICLYKICLKKINYVKMQLLYEIFCVTQRVYFCAYWKTFF